MNLESAVLIDRRMLAAIHPVDPLGAPVRSGVKPSADGAKFYTKPDGTIIVNAWEQLAEFETSFKNQPASPAVGSRRLEIELRPDTPTLMPRRMALSLPRDATPANHEDSASLFQPVRAILPASMAMGASSGASALQCTARVVRDSDDAPVSGAVLRLTQNDAPQASTFAITNRHGEACLLFAGLPLASVGAGAQLTQIHPAKVDLFIDETAIRTDGKEADPIDPDAVIAAGPAALSSPVSLRSRSSIRADLRWSPP